MPAETAAPDDRRLPLSLRLADIAALALARSRAVDRAPRRPSLPGVRPGRLAPIRAAVPLRGGVDPDRHGTCCDRARAPSTTSRSLVTGSGAIRILPLAGRAFLATRPAVLIIGFFAVVTFGIDAHPGFAPSKDPLANLPARFDAGWYGDVALDGYNWDHPFQRQRNIAFFPALPLHDAAPSPPCSACTIACRRTIAHGARIVGWRADFARRIPVGALLPRSTRPGPGRRRSRGERGAAPRGIPVCAVLQRCLHRIGVSACCSWRVLSFPAGRSGARRSAWGLLLGLTRPNGCFASVPLAILGAQQLWESARAQTSARGAGGARVPKVPGVPRVPRVAAM